MTFGQVPAVGSGNASRASWIKWGVCGTLKLAHLGDWVEMHRFRGQRGFTFVEIVMVLVVSSILASFAILKLAPTLEQSRVRRSATSIATDLQWAQMIAARQRRPVLFIVSEGLRSYMIRDASSATVFREAHLGADTDFRIDQLEANPTTLEIFPSGVVRNAGNYVVRVSGVQRNVRISRAGQVRITNVP